MDPPASGHWLVFAVIILVPTSCGSVLAGTTKNLKDIYVGRCWEFQRLTRPELFTDGEKDCDKLWALFSGSFMNKDPCDIAEEDFRDYVTEAAHPIPPDQALLWEEVYPFPYRYSKHGKRATALADYLPGHIAQEIVFCGSEQPPGLNYDHCPPYRSCPGEVQYNFWKELSYQFSQKIEGHTRSIMNGSRGELPAFDYGSIFAERELVNLVSPRVTSLEIWLIHCLDEPKTEVCGEGSLLVLEALAKSQGLEYTCLDDPPETVHLQCVSDSTAEMCVSVTAGSNAGTNICQITRWNLLFHALLNTIPLIITTH